MFFNYNKFGRVLVYTDGACSRNGMQGRAPSAGAGVWFGDNHELNWSSGVPGRQTNQEAELYAVIKAIEILNDYGIHDMEIKTDSDYVLRCMTIYIHKWKTNGWVNSKGCSVVNMDKIQLLDCLMNFRNNSVILTHVMKSDFVHGNIQADILARQGANQ